MYFISFLKINFPGHIDCIQFTNFRYLFQITLHNSN